MCRYIFFFWPHLQSAIFQSLFVSQCIFLRSLELPETIYHTFFSSCDPKKSSFRLLNDCLFPPLYFVFLCSRESSSNADKARVLSIVRNMRIDQFHVPENIFREQRVMTCRACGATTHNAKNKRCPKHKCHSYTEGSGTSSGAASWYRLVWPRNKKNIQTQFPGKLMIWFARDFFFPRLLFEIKGNYVKKSRDLCAQCHILGEKREYMLRNV